MNQNLIENKDSKGRFIKGHKIGIGNKYRLGISPWNKGMKGNPRVKGGRPFGAKDKNKRRTENYRPPRGKDHPSYGKHPPNWKGGSRIPRAIIMDSVEYGLWRKSVFIRDNFTCQKYGIRGGDLHAHHINNFADFPELRLSIDNGICLSERAHNEFHKIYGKKNNTLEQLIEFLNKK